MPAVVLCFRRKSPVLQIQELREKVDGDMAASSKLSESTNGSIEPVMVRIPEGWFGMGCASGADDEKPVHRVWVNAFELAAYR